MSVLSTKMTKIVNAKISEMLNDGMSDNEIVRALRKHARLTDFPELTHKQIKNMIVAILDADETASESSESTASTTSEPTFESDEEDEEWVPPSDAESDSDEESDSEEVAAILMELKEEAVELQVSRIFFDHKDDADGMDRITITPQDDGTFAVEMAYNLEDSFDDPKCANFFDGSKEEVLDYILSVLRLVAVDDLPFRSVEVSVPFFPTVSYKPKTLTKKYVRERIATAFRQYLGHYA